MQQKLSIKELIEIMGSDISRADKVEICLKNMDDDMLGAYTIWCYKLSPIKTKSARYIAELADGDVALGRWTNKGWSDSELAKRKVRKLKAILKRMKEDE